MAEAAGFDRTTGHATSTKCMSRETTWREEFGTRFLLKGGHLGGESATDLLLSDGTAVAEFSAPFVEAYPPTAPACTYSAAIAARLALGDDARSGDRARTRILSAARSAGILPGRRR